MSEGNFEKWFRRCEDHGWILETLSGFKQRVTSPAGVVITWNGRQGVFMYGARKDTEFRRLVNAIIADLDSVIHTSRAKINAARQSTRELREVIGVANEGDPCMVDDWTPGDQNGVSRLRYDYGPLSVDAAICVKERDAAWSVTLEDGREPYRREGHAKGYEAARLAVIETLMEWSDELSETGRHAMRIYTKLKGILG